MENLKNSQNAETGEKSVCGEGENPQNDAEVEKAKEDEGKTSNRPSVTSENDKSSQSPYNDEYKVLTTTQISSKIIDIIKETKEYCLIITPYLKEWHHLQNCLKTASDKKKRIIFFFRDLDDQSYNTKKEITNFYNEYKFDIVFIKKLHAKIYLNENETLLASMNLYDTSQKDNYEIGVLLRNKEIIDNHIKTYIIDEIFNTGKIDKLTKKSDNNFYELLENNLFFEKHITYCVNCGNPRKYKYGYKYCEKCFIIKKTNRKDFDIWTYCHLCGEKYERKYSGMTYNKNKSLFCTKCHTKIQNRT
jgi:phosphatidylserine/phosphatidylglycerophosphate/cardiolipin synthase-like enzyme